MAQQNDFQYRIDRLLTTHFASFKMQEWHLNYIFDAFDNQKK